MSRIRTIKPEFWTSEQVVACSPNARLLFIGLWNFCDDNGVHPASYVRLKAEVFPVDGFTLDEVSHWVGELISNGLLHEYSVADKSYWIVTGWKNHQRIDKPTYRHPLPQSTSSKFIDNSTTTPQPLDESSLNSRRAVEETSSTEWNGKERKGKELNIGEVETSPVATSNTKPSADVTEVFTHWQQIMNHPQAKLDSKRKRTIENALNLGYNVAQLKQAIEGCSKTPFNMGQNDRNERYDDIELILRDAAHIDRFIKNATHPPTATKNNNNSDIMAGVI